MKFWENGTRPLEIVTSNQWLIRYPDKDAMLARGKEIAWWPEFMRVRYENWVNGLQGDWNITRQRFFGVPFPAWYPIDEDGVVDYLSPVLAGEDSLPVDPTTDPAPGYDADQRDKPGGFTADPDVMDTWATSSLTPQIAAGWVDDPDLFARTFPMDMRPQAHDIIRTWLFYTVVRSHYEHETVPWTNAAISGFIVDPDRKKLSKSAANAPDDPAALIESYGADGVRYWAANGRPGMDVVFDEGQLKIGRKLALKVLNASRFALGAGATTAGDVTQPLDRSMLAALADLVAEATTAFDRYDYARAIERTEGFFWSFCDDYLELVKNRAYGDGESGTDAARPRPAPRSGLALQALLGLFAPFLPFVTEEVWSWWQEGSVHRSPWPSADAAPRGRRCRRRGVAGRRARPRRPRGGGRGAGRGPRGQEPGQALDAHRGHVGHRHRHARAAGAAGAGRGRRPLGRPHRGADDRAGRPARGHRRARPRDRGLSPNPAFSTAVSGVLTPETAVEILWGRGQGREVVAVGRVGRGARDLVGGARVPADPGLVLRRANRDAAVAEGVGEPPSQLAHDQELLGGPGLDHQPDGDGLGLEALDAPDLGRLEDLAAPRGVGPQPVRHLLDDRLHPVDVGAPGHLDVEQGPGPLLGHVADPGDGAVGDVPHGALHVAHPGGAQRDGLDRPGRGAGVDDVAHAELVLDQHEDAGEEVLDQALGTEADGHAGDAGAGDERAQVDPQLAEDDGHGDRPDHRAAMPRSTVPSVRARAAERSDSDPLSMMAGGARRRRLRSRSCDSGAAILLVSRRMARRTRRLATKATATTSRMWAGVASSLSAASAQPVLSVHSRTRRQM